MFVVVKKITTDGRTEAVWQGSMANARIRAQGFRAHKSSAPKGSSIRWLKLLNEEGMMII